MFFLSLSCLGVFFLFARTHATLPLYPSSCDAVADAADDGRAARRSDSAVAASTAGRLATTEA